jgi:hypothetical protein
MRARKRGSSPNEASLGDSRVVIHLRRFGDPVWLIVVARGGRGLAHARQYPDGEAAGRVGSGRVGEYERG